MKRIIQQHNCGCVPACIAMLTGRSYISCTRLFKNRTKSWHVYGTTHKQRLQAMKKVGLKFHDKKGYVNLFSLRNNAVILVAHKSYGPPGHNLHVVVWDAKQKKILDPYVSPKRSLKRHLPLKTYQKSMLGVTELI